MNKQTTTMTIDLLHPVILGRNLPTSSVGQKVHVMFPQQQAQFLRERITTPYAYAHGHSPCQ